MRSSQDPLETSEIGPVPVSSVLPSGHRSQTVTCFGRSLSLSNVLPLFNGLSCYLIILSHEPTTVPYFVHQVFSGYTLTVILLTLPFSLYPLSYPWPPSDSSDTLRRSTERSDVVVEETEKSLVTTVVLEERFAGAS